MKQMPEVSVILPAYNAHSTIKDTIISVLNQTFSDFELIIINDGSTDDTLEVVGRIDDSRIQVHTNTNSGPSATRNKGIELAQGNYITFIDSDDMWTEQKLEYQYKALSNQPDYDVAYSWTLFMDISGNILHPVRSVDFSGFVFDELINYNFIGSGSNILVSRDAVIKTGYFNTEYKLSEDWDYSLRLAKSFKFVCVPQFHIQYRQSSNSLTSNIELIESESTRVISDNYNNQNYQNFYKLKNKSISNIKLYSGYLYLTRQSSIDWKKKVYIKCYESIQLYPQNLFNISLVFTMLALLIVLVLPTSYASVVIKQILKGYGRYQMLFSKAES